jgi:hypothetical protein
VPNDTAELDAAHAEVGRLHSDVSALQMRLRRAQRLEADARAAKRSEAAALRRTEQESASNSGTPVAPAVTSCTQTSSGTCIQGGEFCASAEAGQYGTDANGRQYLCTDGHWENP